MSSSIFLDKIILKSKKNDPYINFKPERKDDNYHFSNSISYNMIECLTMFKNKEIDHSTLNKYLFGNLGFLITKKNITLKKKIEKEKKTNNNNFKFINYKQNSLNSLSLNYDCYIPTKRLTIFNKKNTLEKNIEKLNLKGSKKKISLKLLKLPMNIEKLNFFKPFGKSFDTHKKANRKISTTSVYSLGSNSYSNEDFINANLDENESNSEFNLTLKEPNNDINLLEDDEFLNLIKKNPCFPKYKELTEYIGCPLIDCYSNKTRYNIFMNILNNFLNMEDYYPIESENNKELDSINNIELDNQTQIIEKKVFIDCNLNYNYDIFKDLSKSSEGKLLQKGIKSIIGKSENISYTSWNKTTASEITNNFDDEPSEGESLFAFFQNEKNDKQKSQFKLQKKIKMLLPKSYGKYLKKMNKEYIAFMHVYYKNIYNKCQESKMFIMDDDTILKKFYMQSLKKLLLDIGISQKKCYEKILKNQIYKNTDFFSFEQFMNNFEQNLLDSKEFKIGKYLLLFYILPHENNDSFLTQVELNQFFDLIGCEFINDPQVCKIISEKLIAKYELLYGNDEIKNIYAGKYRFRKVKITLEFFLDFIFDDME